MPAEEVTCQHPPSHDDPRAVASTFDGRVDLFGHAGQAKLYSSFRPSYNNEIVESVLELIPILSRKLCVDVACGPGLFTAMIAPHFEKTIGLDMSLEQLNEATTVDGAEIKYVAGSAFSLPLEPESVDLVAVAQGLHWLIPYGKFFTEVLRVLKPGGSFVALAYAFPRLICSRANSAVRRFYEDVLGGHLSPGDPGCWWETNRPTIDGFYQDIDFPLPSTLRHFNEKKRMRVIELMNYLRTLSAYRTLLRSGESDPLPVVEASLMLDAVDGYLDVEIPYFTVSFTKSM